MHRLTLVRLMVLAMMASVFFTTVPAQAAPSYSPYSSTYWDMKARAAYPDKARGRTYVQVNRLSDSSGDRQVFLAWKRNEGQKRTAQSDVVTLRPGKTVTFKSGTVPCGREITVTLTARMRTSSEAAWSDWKQVTLTPRRVC